MLTDAAANTLLKSLEEPPDHVVFVLATTNPEQVLPDDPVADPALRVHAAPHRAARRAPRRLCAREGVDADPEALAIVARGAARGRCATRCRCSTRRSRTPPAASTSTEVAALFGGAPFELRAQILQAIADGDAATVLVELGALLDSGHEPRRVAEDLLRARVRRVPAHRGCGPCGRRGHRGGTAPRSRELGAALGNAGVVRVDRDARSGDRRHARRRRRRPAARARGRARAAEPSRSRAADRAAGRAGGAARSRAVAGGRRPSSSAPPSSHPLHPTASTATAASPPKRALGAVRSERAARAPEPEPDARSPRPGKRSSRCGLDHHPRRPRAPPRRRSTSTTSSSRGRRSCPTCRWRRARRCSTRSRSGSRATSSCSGSRPRRWPRRRSGSRTRPTPSATRSSSASDARPKFQLEPSDLVDLAGGGRGPTAVAKTTHRRRSTTSRRRTIEPDDFDPGDIVDAEPAGPAVSSVGLLEAEFGATVVEERPRAVAGRRGSIVTNQKQLNQMMRQVQKMQADMVAAQEALARGDGRGVGGRRHGHRGGVGHRRSEDDLDLARRRRPRRRRDARGPRRGGRGRGHPHGAGARGRSGWVGSPAGLDMGGLGGLLGS